MSSARLAPTSFALTAPLRSAVATGEPVKLIAAISPVDAVQSLHAYADGSVASAVLSRDFSASRTRSTASLFRLLFALDHQRRHIARPSALEIGDVTGAVRDFAAVSPAAIRVLVMIGDSDDSPLQHMFDADARRLQSLFERAGVPNNRITVVHPNSPQQAEALLQRAAEEAPADGALVVLHSGHGTPQGTVFGSRELLDSTLAEHLSHVAGRVLFLSNSCFGGARVDAIRAKAIEKISTPSIQHLERLRELLCDFCRYAQLAALIPSQSMPAGFPDHKAMLALIQHALAGGEGSDAGDSLAALEWQAQTRFNDLAGLAAGGVVPSETANYAGLMLALARTASLIGGERAMLDALGIAKTITRHPLLTGQMRWQLDEQFLSTTVGGLIADITQRLESALHS